VGAASCRDRSWLEATPTQGSCRKLPVEGEVLGKILKYAELLPGEKLTMIDVLPMG